MDSLNHKSHFEQSKVIYYTRIKSAYLDGIKNSFNKEYAADYFRTILLDDNDAIPYKTVFYSELKVIFDHFYSLKGNDAISEVIEYLEIIRKNSADALGQLERFRDGFGDPNFMQLPVHYEQQLEIGVEVSEIIEQENQVLSLTDEQVVELLALHRAIQQLKDELLPNQSETNSQAKPDNDRKDRLTRSQQVLVFYFLLEVSGLNYNGANITDCARLLHKLIGLAEPDEISNSDLYKKLKKPMGDYDRKTIQDLRAILPYFEKLPHYGAIKLINTHLRSCDGD